MNKHNILGILSTLSGAGFMGIDTKTIVTLPKKNPLHNRLEKIVTGSLVQCFQNKLVNGYEAMVKRRLENEGRDSNDFTLSPRTWGERVQGLPIVTHKGEAYFEVIFQKAGDVQYILDGNPVSKEQIAEYLPNTPQPKQGGLDDKVALRTFKMDSITAIRYNGTEYKGEFYYPAEA